MNTTTMTISWMVLFYGGAALVGHSVGEYSIAFGGAMVLNACIIAYNIGR